CWTIARRLDSMRIASTTVNDSADLSADLDSEARGAATVAPAVTRAAAILDALAEQPAAATPLSDLARRLGLPKSSVANICDARGARAGGPRGTSPRRRGTADADSQLAPSRRSAARRSRRGAAPRARDRRRGDRGGDHLPRGGDPAAFRRRAVRRERHAAQGA